MRSYHVLRLSEEYIEENNPISVFENLVKTMPPSYKENEGEDKLRIGFFGFARFDNGASMNHYSRRDKRIKDPYTKEDLYVSELKVSRISYISDSDDDLYIISQGLEKNVFKTLNLAENDYQLVSFDADFIRFLNTSSQNHRCYKKVFDNTLYSIGRAGANDQGHKLREEYLTLSDRETNIGTDMNLYAMLAVTTNSSGVFRLFLHNNGKITIINDGVDFAKTSTGIAELIDTLDKAHKNYVTCLRNNNVIKN